VNLLDKEQKRTKRPVHQPIPGYWYTSTVGQLQQVRIVLHEGQQQSRVVLENINGRRRTVSMDGWYRLDLTLHSPGNERRRRRTHSDSSEDPS
jgi:hypothetical protein